MKKLNEKASAVRFLLGGIGTGNISLDQNARFCDFELWNSPNKGFRSPFTFFAVRIQQPDGKVFAKALESQLVPPFMHGHGAPAQTMEGLSRFKYSEMEGDLPFAHYTFTDDNMPITAELEAFSPFIPLDTDNSSLPAAVLRYSIKNNSAVPLVVSVAGSFCNLSGLKDKDSRLRRATYEPSINRFVKNEACQGIHFLSSGKTEKDYRYFESSLLTTEKENISYLELWYQGAWVDGLQDFWNDFTSDGELTNGRSVDFIGNKHVVNSAPVGSVCVKKEIEPGQRKSFEFIISWYQPNRVKSWSIKEPCYSEDCHTQDQKLELVKNYYAKFGNALESASYLVKNLKRLEEESRKFVKALNTGDLPESVIDAVLATATVIRSNTCFRLEDGTFYGWEGCNDDTGSCDGNCTHVWNYTQSMAFLFPELERSMRKTEFIYETENDGRQYFRARHNMQDPPHDMPPAADGQLGTIIRLYRDWKLCGDDNFLKEMWPNAKLALEYAFAYWDKDGDGVLDGQQHNTYDIEFYGVTSMINSIFFAALRAGEEISLYLGDKTSEEKYKVFREKGEKKVDALCFNGEYYEQKLDDIDKYKYQYGKGCLADQLLGQQLAHVSGLGYILDKEHVKKAVKSIFTYCFLENFEDFDNLQRTYARNDDGGLLLCSWPKGGRPEIPFVYSDEVWTGVEYQVASHLIYEGFVTEGLRIVEACRDRHDGIKRSPWNEVECGHHYARSLASYGVLLALTGFRCDAVNKILYFKPAINQDNFTGFFCCPAGWGLYRQKKNSEGYRGEIETLHGDLDGYKIVIY
ncbi:non-lysosomal glucosylceramidase [Treponema sp. OttesenSCG-928-L16]|nr:non-lysosomal glucosylceramidase [Treponema sp. OttesenSCG-928-L16]